MIKRLNLIIRIGSFLLCGSTIEPFADRHILGPRSARSRSVTGRQDGQQGRRLVQLLVFLHDSVYNLLHTFILTLHRSCLSANLFLINVIWYELRACARHGIQLLLLNDVVPDPLNVAPLVEPRAAELVQVLNSGVTNFADLDEPPATCLVSSLFLDEI